MVYSLQDAAQDQTDLYAVREDGSGKVQIREMARAGLALNLIGAVVITVVCLLAFG